MRKAACGSPARRLWPNATNKWALGMAVKVSRSRSRPVVLVAASRPQGIVMIVKTVEIEETAATGEIGGREVLVETGAVEIAIAAIDKLSITLSENAGQVKSAWPVSFFRRQAC